MPKRSSKQKDTVPDAEPKKPAPNKANPPRPTKKQDVKDIDRADSEGMAQPQGLEAKPSKARAKKLTGKKRSEIAKKAARKSRAEPSTNA